MKPAPSFAATLLLASVVSPALAAPVWLTGEVRAFGHQDGPIADAFDFRVQVTGGQLAFLFEGADAYVVLGSLESSFAGSFASSFGGGALGNIKVTPSVPEPSAALLFAACLLLVVRQR